MAKTLLASRPAPHLPVPAASVTTAPGAGTCIISSEIGTADRQAVLDLFTRSSPDTRRDRFHGWFPPTEPAMATGPAQWGGLQLLARGYPRSCWG